MRSIVGVQVVAGGEISVLGRPAGDTRAAERLHLSQPALSAQIKALERLTRRRVPPEQAVTNELARELTELSRELLLRAKIFVEYAPQTRIERRATVAAAARAGDHRYVASPRVDSYHGAWFELHEDLILLAGRNRADEVAAGRA